jgi:hypothetical protein
MNRAGAVEESPAAGLASGDLRRAWAEAWRAFFATSQAGAHETRAEARRRSSWEKDSPRRSPERSALVFCEAEARPAGGLPARLDWRSSNCPGGLARWIQSIHRVRDKLRI